jgi:hypothetical protein
MKTIDVTQPLQMADGKNFIFQKPKKDGTGSEEENYTVRVAILDSLFATKAEIANEEKIQRYWLGKKVANNDEVELDDMEVQLILNSCVLNIEGFGALYEVLS